jgi:hypothetical protein
MLEDEGHMSWSARISSLYSLLVCYRARTLLAGDAPLQPYCTEPTSLEKVCLCEDLATLRKKTKYYHTFIRRNFTFIRMLYTIFQDKLVL